MDLYNLAEEYADNIIASEEFQELLNLKKAIQEKLSGKIIAFKTAEAKYLEAKSYDNYHPNLTEYQRTFMTKKKELFEEELVKKYKELENQIQTKIDKDINDLKQTISNKFVLTKILK